jgi:hypothetical protein
MGRNIAEAEAASASHQLVKHTHFYSNIYYNPTANSRYDIWRCSFTKQLSADKSYLVVEGHMNGTGFYNYPVIGQYLTIDHWGVGSNNATADLRAYGGVVCCGPDANSNQEQCVMVIRKIFKSDSLSPDPHPNIFGTFPASELGAGSHSMDLGFAAGSDIKICQNINEVSGNHGDGRRHQGGSYLSIMEFAL